DVRVDLPRAVQLAPADDDGVGGGQHAAAEVGGPRRLGVLVDGQGAALEGHGPAVVDGGEVGPGRAADQQRAGVVYRRVQGGARLVGERGARPVVDRAAGRGADGAAGPGGGGGVVQRPP